MGQLEAGRPPALDVPAARTAGSGDDPAGAVVASSPNVAGDPAVARLAAGRAARVITPLDNDPFIAVAEGAQTADGQRNVVVARALVDVLDTTTAITRLLIFGVPVMVAVVALTTWFAVGRALAPVEAIRREVDEISAAQLHRRVPQPKADDEIGRLAATMNRMLERLESARNSQRRFVSDASHELRSPITTIRQHAEVALAHPDRTTTEELADVVLAEQHRMQGLVEDLLLLARADERVPPCGRRSTSTTWRSRRGVGSVRRPRSGWTRRGWARRGCKAMPTRCGRVFRNLGENAARHAASRVEIALADLGGDVVLTVDDDGPGIPESERDRVLKRFVRLDESRSRDDGGSGLGLAIVDEVVRAHGGSMSIAQSPLGGVRIQVTCLPMRADRVQVAVR